MIRHAPFIVIVLLAIGCGKKDDSSVLDAAVSTAAPLASASASGVAPASPNVAPSGTPEGTPPQAGERRNAAGNADPEHGRPEHGTHGGGETPHARKP